VTTHRNQIPKLPSDRSFGITFTIVFSIITGWLWWKTLPGTGILAALAFAFLIISFARPHILHPLNRAWMAFGALLHHVISPLVLGIIYFGLFTPIAFALRLRGRDAMRRRADPQLTSYWLRRDPPGPAPESLNNQF
jgi:hypothetical protein